MWKAFFLAVALLASMSPLDAHEQQRPRQERRMEKTQREDLRRDVERISKEIYPPHQERRR
jgi:hypothetical protein